jgi:O-antigen/teichoic acid export membrane protein
MVSTVGSAGLGLAFWVIAAHIFKPDEVGRASAEVAAITLIAGLGQLSLVSVFARFLPVARRRTGMIIKRGYVGALVATFLLSCAFVALRLGNVFLDPDALSIAVFVISVLLFVIFALQDVVLTALRRATWVLTENILVAGVRLALLPILVVAGRRMGLLGAWALPMIGAIAIVNWLAFRRLVPEKESAGDDRGLLPTRAEILNYGIAQYVNGVIGSVITLLPPVLVASLMGASASGVFYLPWLFCTSCMALLWNIVFSLVVEAVQDVDRTPQLLARATWMCALVTCGGGLVLGFGAPWILGVVGSTYAASGTVVLRLIALSLPFIGVTTLYSAVSLIEKRTWMSTLLQGIGAAIFLVGGILSAPRYGLAGFGMAFLASKVVIALASAPSVVLRFRSLAVPDPKTVFTVDHEAPAMASETQIMYPMFVARGAARGVARVPTPRAPGHRRSTVYHSNADQMAAQPGGPGTVGPADMDATVVAGLDATAIAALDTRLAAEDTKVTVRLDSKVIAALDARAAADDTKVTVRLDSEAVAAAEAMAAADQIAAADLDTTIISRDGKLR